MSIYVGNTEVKQLSCRPSLFLNKSIALYGPSNSGKTILIKNIMKTLKHSVGNVIVVSPSEINNHAYRSNVPNVLIHDSLYMDKTEKILELMENLRCNFEKKDYNNGALRFLATVKSRQEALTNTYETINDKSVLLSLYGKIPEDKKEIFKEGFKKIKMVMKSIENRNRSIDKADDIYYRYMKKCIRDSKPTLIQSVQDGKIVLTENEQYSLKHINFNPNLLLVLDDCAADLKKICKTPLLRSFFYQNRHFKTTLVFSCQDDTDIYPNLRRNVFINIFTTAKTARSFFTRVSHGCNMSKNKINGIVSKVFSVKNRKLFYVRMDSDDYEYYHFTGTIKLDFMMCPKLLRQYCRKVEKNKLKVKPDNMFTKDIRKALKN
jgi:hypothetical protein